MPELETWVKDNGDEIKINTHPATVAQAVKLGWKKKGAKTKQAK